MRVLTTIAVVLLAGSIVAQAPAGAIAGKVVDRYASAFLGIVVTLTGPASTDLQTVVTDAAGTYEFANVPDGTYRLEFRRLGYCPETQDDIVVAKGVHVKVNAKVAEPATHGRCEDQTGQLVVRLETTLGVIDIAVNASAAPATAVNFLKLVYAHAYDGGRFYRATTGGNMHTAPNQPFEFVEAGIDPARRAAGPTPIPLERAEATGMQPSAGTAAMVWGGQASPTTDLVIVLVNNQPSASFSDNNAFREGNGSGAAAPFGGVLAGLDVVRRIQQQPMDVQTLRTPVTILRAYRIE